MEADLKAFLGALRENTRSNDALREEVARLREEFAALRANAPRDSSAAADADPDPVDIVANAGGELLKRLIRRKARKR